MPAGTSRLDTPGAGVRTGAASRPRPPTSGACSASSASSRPSSTGDEQRGPDEPGEVQRRDLHPAQKYPYGADRGFGSEEMWRCSGRRGVSAVVVGFGLFLPVADADHGCAGSVRRWNPVGRGEGGLSCSARSARTSPWRHTAAGTPGTGGGATARGRSPHAGKEKGKREDPQATRWKTNPTVCRVHVENGTTRAGAPTGVDKALREDGFSTTRIRATPGGRASERTLIWYNPPLGPLRTLARRGRALPGAELRKDAARPTMVSSAPTRRSEGRPRGGAPAGSRPGQPGKGFPA